MSYRKPPYRAQLLLTVINVLRKPWERIFKKRR